MRGRPQLATTPEFIQACQEMEKDDNMALSKSDICNVLVDLSKRKAEASNEWKLEQQHQPDRHSVDRYFALYPSWKGSEEDYDMVYWGTLALELCKFCRH